MRDKIKHYFEVTSPVGNIRPHLVALNQPFKENAAFKSGWTPLTTVHHASGDQSILDEIVTLLAKFYSFGSKVFENGISPSMETDIQSMLGTGKLTAYNRVGGTLETWTLIDLWPHSVNFGELCYSNSSDVTLEVEWRFKNCVHIISPA